MSKRRQVIIKAVIDLIAKKGVESVTTVEIAKKLKIAPSGIFYHFESIPMLLNEVQNFVMLEAEATVKQVLEKHSDSKKCSRQI